MEKESPLKIIDVDTGKELSRVKITTNLDNAKVTILLKNTGRMKVRNIALTAKHGVKFISPKPIPSSLNPGEEVKVVLQVDTNVDEEYPLDIEYSYIETVFN